MSVYISSTNLLCICNLLNVECCTFSIVIQELQTFTLNTHPIELACEIEHIGSAREETE